MIATVRIAPVERWCPAKRVGIDWDAVRAKQDNPMVKILTGTMKQCQWCDGRAWVHEPNDVNELRASVGREPISDERWLCEHMLEMD